MKIRKNFAVLSFVLLSAMLLINLVSRVGGSGTAVSTPTTPTGTNSNFLYLPLVMGPDNHIPVASVLVPFDANVSDLIGPTAGSAANYA